uniref:WAT1-related protein n=2 Tax=Oryza TaxID=4527 RepID=A0A0D3FVV1_9ORYZ
MGSESGRAVAAMVSLQLLFSALQVFIKLALNDGMDARVLVAYRFMFAATFLCPIAFLRERKKRPPLTMKVVLQLFLCGLFGFSINQNLYVLAIKLTSATYITAISNLTPATTFLLAILTRLETLKLKKPAGQAKLLGTLVGMGGAMLLTFYKGPKIMVLDQLPHPKFAHLTENPQSHPISTGNQIIGSFLGIISCFTYATWLVIQAKVSKVYPCHYSIAAMVCLFGALQSTVMALCVHRDMEHWRLGLNIRLYSSAYAGLVASGSAFPLLSWCLRKKGPLFISVFSPLMLIFVALMSSVILNEALHLGSVLGSVLIVGGLYMVLWGKAKEAADLSEDENQGKESIPVTTGGENEMK